jgi:hypothetical protein
VDLATGTVGFSVQHQYADDGPANGNGTPSDLSTIAVTIADDDGGSGSNSGFVTVNNMAPVVTLDPISNTTEPGTVTLTGAISDAGLKDAHTITVGWGDPNNPNDSTFNVDAIVPGIGSSTLYVGEFFNSTDFLNVLQITSIDFATGMFGFSVQHTYSDDGPSPGNGTDSDLVVVSVKVSDDDGETGTSARFLVINNSAPVLSLNPIASIPANGTATLSGFYRDVGLHDAQTLTIQWGDQSVPSMFQMPALRDSFGISPFVFASTFISSSDGAMLTCLGTSSDGLVEFSVSHQYTSAGTATIDVSVLDDDGGKADASTSVQVDPNVV